MDALLAILAERQRSRASGESHAPQEAAGSRLWARDATRLGSRDRPAACAPAAAWAYCLLPADNRKPALETSGVAVYMEPDPAADKGRASPPNSGFAQRRWGLGKAPRPMNPTELQLFKNLFSRTPEAIDLDLESFARVVEAEEVTVVDVREPHEFAAGHIPDAVNLPMSRFDPAELPTGKPVVLICQSGGRSRNALSRARAAGRDDVKHYPGGMSQWRMHGGDVTV